MQFITISYIIANLSLLLQLRTQTNCTSRLFIVTITGSPAGLIPVLMAMDDRYRAAIPKVRYPDTVSSDCDIRV